MIKKTIIALTVAASIAVVGCGEQYTPVNDNQVVVQDDGKLDKRNIAVACGEAFKTNRATISATAPSNMDGDGQVAVVTCSPESR